MICFVYCCFGWAFVLVFSCLFGSIVCVVLLLVGLGTVLAVCGLICLVCFDSFVCCGVLWLVCVVCFGLVCFGWCG